MRVIAVRRGQWRKRQIRQENTGMQPRIAMLQLLRDSRPRMTSEKHRVMIQEALPAPYKNHALAVVKQHVQNTIFKFAIYLKTQKRIHFTTHLKPGLYGIHSRYTTVLHALSSPLCIVALFCYHIRSPFYVLSWTTCILWLLGRFALLYWGFFCYRNYPKNSHP